MSILEARIPFLHMVYRADGERDSHGNKTGSYDDPVERMAISVYPLSASTTRDDVVNPNVVVRTETDVVIDVDDPSIFGAQDKVELLGVMFKVQGQPAFSSWDNMPIDGYADIVPGNIHVQRVT